MVSCDPLALAPLSKFDPALQLPVTRLESFKPAERTILVLGLGVWASQSIHEAPHLVNYAPGRDASDECLTFPRRPKLRSSPGRSNFDEATSDKAWHAPT